MSRTERSPVAWAAGLAAAVLVLATLAVYLPAVENGFANYDDDQYVLQNSHVQSGLSWEGLKWAFRSTEASNWHPLTWLSLQLDFRLWGASPNPAAGFHLTSVILHVLSTLVLFITLRRMTKTVWRSAFVAGLFALHPLHVESVAWVAERKDVLSTFFGLLAIWAFVRFTEKRTALRYAPIVLFFGLSLLAKPMFVTLPCLLLLLDYWPLARFQQEGGTSNLLMLVKEKLPLVGLAAVSSIITTVVQQARPAFVWRGQLPFAARAGNALLSYVRYIGKMVFPSGLIPMYSYSPTATIAWMAPLAGVVLLAATFLIVRYRSRCPYLLTGWLWYLGMLVPVIGIFPQIGVQSMADRYTYVPLVGLFVAVAWGALDLVKGWRPGVAVAAGLGGILLIDSAMLTANQIGYWKDGFTLWSHALEVDNTIAAAHKGLGAELLERNQVPEALEHFRTATELDPGDWGAHFNLSVALGQSDRVDEAMFQLEEATRLLMSSRPENRRALGTWGAQLARARRDEPHPTPDDAQLHYDLAVALEQLGESDEAVLELEEVVRLDPDHAAARAKLGSFRATAQDRLRAAPRRE